jgi:chromosome partitioning protein
MPPCGRARVIVVGNEKGGTGKSTIAFHVIVALLRRGATVASLDLDARQGTLSRYMENRASYAAARGLDLPMPSHGIIRPGDGDDLARVREEERVRFEAAFARLAADHDYVVMDTPGRESHLSGLAHSYADTLITPINDSFVDLDLIAEVKPDGLRVMRASSYSAAVFEHRKKRAARDGASIDWIVLRNRLTSLDAVNKRNMADVLERLASRIGFRQVAGFGERVVFRELFLKGLTLLDLRDAGLDVDFSLSHIAARQEVWALLEAIGVTARQPADAETPVFR